MISYMTKTLLLGSAVLAVTGCATHPMNPLITDAQTRLSTAYSDKATAERGQADLANADSALHAAADEWQHGDRTKSDHQLTMAQTYLDIADTRGQQAKVELDTARLRTQAQLAVKDRQLEGKDRQIAGKNQQLADKNQELANAQDQLRDYNMKITELGSTMVLQDVSFESSKASLLPGGINRLQPLINYLRVSPQTRVRIEGNTDNVGGATYNQQLSLDRANSVKATLTAANIDADRIETMGSGFSKPVASNKTVSGREANRRVEITLLKQPGV